MDKYQDPVYKALNLAFPTDQPKSPLLRSEMLVVFKSIYDSHDIELRALKLENARFKSTLEKIVEDDWYKNGFVPCEDSQARHGMLIDRINSVRTLARAAINPAPGKAGA